MNSLLIITGAGASHDVISINRVPSKNMTYQPPLTNNLFLCDRNLATGGPYSAQCLQEHPVAAQVGHEFYNRCGSNKKSDAKSLEQYLREIKSSKSPIVRRQFWAIPLYFFQLFYEISCKYSATKNPGLPSNYKSLLDRISESNYDQIIWLNLNYDLLADFAITNTISNKLQDLGDYMHLEIRGHKTVILKYTKPHGSIDWFKAINNSITNLTEIQCGRAPDDFERFISEEIIKTKVSPDGRVVGRPSNSYPAITAPMGEYKFVYQEHINQIIPDLKITNSVLCIGFSALDQDILNLLKDNISEISKLKIVNGSEQSSNESYERIFDGTRDESGKSKVKTSREEAIYYSGFSDFLGGELDNWLTI